MEHKSLLSRSLVVGHSRDGRCCYDREAKRELVEACLQPGISVARVAMEHGINANLLRKWINQYRDLVSVEATRPPATLPAFTPVLSMAAPKPAEAALTVALPNGVKLTMQAVGLAELSHILTALSALPCSASSRD